ncbi:hypothetical protein [Aquibacillus rhizosphaerae]|uniref:Pilus assembly protein PilO n=1 Tax=Aquibacillus rhizosphaerae TaxID=3051431 RepID=A0ABT7LAU2_9BACI|nr:hypothetical protein [Aquibacillus sp. LR5S19]MDL4841671.1 hypothetical protein [Aquibacillus sp. LR5S19]
MMIKWTRLQQMLLILVIVLGAASYLFGHIFFVQPIKNDVQLVKEEIEFQEHIIANAKKKVDDSEQLETSTSLQQKVSVGKQTDQLLLLLKNIQDISNSTINQYSISYEPLTTEQDTGGNANDQGTQGIAGIETINYELQVNSDNYSQMYTFLQELRSMERIVEINSIQFGSDAGDDFGFSVGFTAFYSPNLEELEPEAPTFEHQPSADKKTPFPQ